MSDDSTPVNISSTKTTRTPLRRKTKWEWSFRSKRTKSFWFGSSPHAVLCRIPEVVWKKLISDFSHPLEFLSAYMPAALSPVSADDGYGPDGIDPARSYITYEGSVADRDLLLQLTRAINTRSRLSKDVRELRRRLRKRLLRRLINQHTHTYARWLYLGTEVHRVKFFKTRLRARTITWVEKTRVWKRVRKTIVRKNRTNIVLTVWTVVRVIRRRRSKIVTYWQKIGPYFRVYTRKRFGWVFGHRVTDWAAVKSEYRELVYDYVDNDESLLTLRRLIAEQTSLIKDLRGQLRNSYTQSGNHMCSAHDDAGLYRVPSIHMETPNVGSSYHAGDIDVSCVLAGASAGVNRDGHRRMYAVHGTVWPSHTIRTDLPTSLPWQSMKGVRRDITDRCTLRPQWDYTPEGAVSLDQRIQQGSLALRNLDLRPEQFVLYRSIAELKDLPETYLQYRTLVGWLRRTPSKGVQSARTLELAYRSALQLERQGLQSAGRAASELEFALKNQGKFKWLSLSVTAAVILHLSYKFAIAPTVSDVRMAIDQGWDFLTTTRRGLVSLLRSLNGVSRDALVKAMKRVQSDNNLLSNGVPPKDGSINIVAGSAYIRPTIELGVIPGIYGPYPEPVVPTRIQLMQHVWGTPPDFSVGGFLALSTLYPGEYPRIAQKLLDMNTSLQAKWWDERLRSASLPCGFANMVDARLYAHYRLQDLVNLADRCRSWLYGDWFSQTAFVKSTWELTPLSFIIDWFSNTYSIASTLQNLVGIHYSRVADPVDGVWLSCRNSLLFGFSEWETSTLYRLEEIRWDQHWLPDLYSDAPDISAGVVDQCRLDYRLSATPSRVYFDPPQLRPIQVLDRPEAVGKSSSHVFSYRRVPLETDLASALTPRSAVRLNLGKVITLVEMLAQALGIIRT